MIKVPETKDEAIGLGAKLAWWASRLHLISIAIGVVGTIILQLLVGFWGFRSEHQVLIRAQYEETLAAHATFQKQLEAFNAVFEGVQDIESQRGAFRDQKEESELGSFRDAAQTYIREIQEASRLLPATEDEVLAYVEAISSLNKYYSVSNPPEQGSVDWLLFFGAFREDFDRYVETREAYLSELASEVGGYWRAVWNS